GLQGTRARAPRTEATASGRSLAERPKVLPMSTCPARMRGTAGAIRTMLRVRSPGFSVVPSASLALNRSLNSVRGIPSNSLSISRYIAIDYGSFPHGIRRRGIPAPPGEAGRGVWPLHRHDLTCCHGPEATVLRL